MNEKIVKMMMSLALGLVAMTFAACGSDDDDDSGSGSGSGVTGYYISGDLYTYSDLMNDFVWASNSQLPTHTIYH